MLYLNAREQRVTALTWTNMVESGQYVREERSTLLVGAMMSHGNSTHN